jgi:alkyl hydroperoxide reductase subunit AhpC
MIASGLKGLAIIEDQELIYEIQTEFEARYATFSEKEKLVLIIDTDGYFRSFPWRQSLREEAKIDQDNISDF